MAESGDFKYVQRKQLETSEWECKMVTEFDECNMPFQWEQSVG